MAISATARSCALGILACCFGPQLLGCAIENGDDAENAESVSEALAADTAMYGNASLTPPWQSWSWSSTVSMSNTDAPMRSGSTSQIKTTINGPYGALSLAHASGDLPISSYSAISFDIRATSSSTVYLTLQTLGGTSSGASKSMAVTTSWTSQSIPISSVKGALSTFGKVSWMGPQTGQTFYIDNVKLVPSGSTTTTPPPPTTGGSSSYPSSPLAVTKNTVMTMYSSASPYFLVVPNAYDATHKTPSKLLVWMHGCGGDAKWDAQVVSPGGSQSWVTVSVGGRDGACWNIGSDSSMVLAALDDVKHRLNIDPKRVVIGGYSSGGNLAYRTAFYNAGKFAGVIGENTGLFYGTGSSESQSMAAASWKLNIAHLAHTSDTTYPISVARTETDDAKAKGFPVTRLERAGTHWDNDSTSSGTGTNYDLRTYLLPYLDRGWVAP